jgi:hypothetical protein
MGFKYWHQNDGSSLDIRNIRSTNKSVKHQRLRVYYWMAFATFDSPAAVQTLFSPPF